VIRRAARAAASVIIILGWVLSLLWLVLSVSQVAVGGITLPTCQAPPVAALMTAPEFNRAILEEVTRC
jgi:hypothetical protein